MSVVYGEAPGNDRTRRQKCFAKFRKFRAKRCSTVRQTVVNINQINTLNNLQYITRESFVFYDISTHVVLFNVEIQLEFVGPYWLSLSVNIGRV